MNKNKQKEAGVGPFLNIFLEKSRGGGGGICTVVSMLAFYCDYSNSNPEEVKKIIFVKN